MSLKFNMRYSSKVFKGSQTGRTIKFPTVNLDPTTLAPNTKQGVYACQVKYNDKIYLGALYFGPRLVLHETKNVLEIYIIDFDKEIYGETIEFQIKDFIRGILNFGSIEEMQRQLNEDIERVKELLIPNT